MMNFDEWWKKECSDDGTEEEYYIAMVAWDAAARAEREACADMVACAAAGFCGVKAEIVMRTVATEIRDRANE